MSVEQAVRPHHDGRALTDDDDTETHGPLRSAAADGLLNADHPLARAEARLHMLIAQSTAVSILAAGLGLAWLTDPDGTHACLFGAAAAVQTVLAIALVLVAQTRRDAVLRLIASGRGDLPLATVGRASRRLLSRTRRERLARSLDQLHREVARPVRGRLPMYSRPVVGSVDSELATVARLLRAPQAPPQGVAMALLLLTADSSPLYGQDAQALRRELGRLTFQLHSAEVHGIPQRHVSPIESRSAPRTRRRDGGGARTH